MAVLATLAASDAAYVARRNALIPFAERYADRLSPVVPGLPPFVAEERRAGWDRAFLGEMDRLWRAVRAVERARVPPWKEAP